MTADGDGTWSLTVDLAPGAWPYKIVEVTEGAGRTRDEVEVIGEVVLESLPSRPRGTPIEVVYRYTVNQILEVDVLDIETRALRSARLDMKGGLGATGVGEAREKLSKAKVS